MTEYRELLRNGENGALIITAMHYAAELKTASDHDKNIIKDRLNAILDELERRQLLNVTHRVWFEMEKTR